jgi:hypothetical protein
VIRGSCLCGRVQYEIAKPLRIIEHCHCSMCRKSHGAAFASDGLVMRSDFRWSRGEDELARYESSPGTYRCFCRVCGSRLAMEPGDLPQALVVYLGTLDDDPGGRPGAHIFVDDRAAWYEITDSLPRFSRGLEGPRSDP